MSRRAAPSSTALGSAIQAKRGKDSVHQAGAQVGVAGTTVAALERGAHRPSVDTALALARWLGWSVEDVIAAAKRPA